MENQKWYESCLSDNSVVVSSRVRLARNLEKYPFPLKLSQDESVKLIDDIISSVDNQLNFQKIDCKKLDKTNQQGLLERHIISPLFLMNKSEKSLLLSEDESTSVMINEEDHIRIQTILPGDNIKVAYEKASEIDDLMEKSLDYAFDKDYGYLTSCPTNTGTGLRASFMLHLPALEATGRLQYIVPSIAKFRLSLRGIYGEHSQSLGSMYQISNQITLGCPEKDIIENLQTFTNSLIDEEINLRNNIFSQNNYDVLNKIYRSYGMLLYSKKISAKEAMSLLSDIRLGFNVKILDVPHPKKTIYNIMMEIQPGNIQKIAGKELNDIERDLFRAEYIKECLNNI